MNRLFSTIKNNFIEITPKAWDKMKLISKKKNNNIFLLSAKSGGCNGFNYDLSLKDEKFFKKTIKESKIPLNIIQNENTKILIDPCSEFLLVGTTIDFVTEDLDKGFFENKFIFTPDKKNNTSCGCGISFSPKK